MNQNSKSVKKSNGCLKVFLIVFALLFVIGVITSIFGKDSEDTRKEITKPVLEKIVWDSLDYAGKLNILNSFIKGDGEPFKTHNANMSFKITSSGKQTVKFPDTYEYMGYDNEWHKGDGYFFINDKNSKIKDTERGLIEVVFDYRAENRYGTKVRQSIIMTLKYNGNDMIIIDARDN